MSKILTLSELHTLVAEVHALTHSTPSEAQGAVLAVLQAIEYNQLISHADQADLLRHCQRGGKPEKWYWWAQSVALIPLQMPDLWRILQRAQELDEQLQVLTIATDEEKQDEA